MALSDFFRINLPYGMEKNIEGNWFVFNREYKPLGWNTRDHIDYEDYPIFVKYKGLTEKKLESLACPKENSIRKDDAGKINKVWFYSDGTNPQSYPKYWSDYLDKIKILSKLKI